MSGEQLIESSRALGLPAQALKQAVLASEDCRRKLVHEQDRQLLEYAGLGLEEAGATVEYCLAEGLVFWLRYMLAQGHTQRLDQALLATPAHAQLCPDLGVRLWHLSGRSTPPPRFLPTHTLYP
jgi:hypothetical protein